MKSFIKFILESEEHLLLEDKKNKFSGHLNKIAPGEIVGAHQAANDPDTNHIMKNGKTFTDYDSKTSKQCQGPAGDCHWNVAKLHKAGKLDGIGVGYTKNHHGWHQHTWGMKNDKVVETTPSNMHNTHWHGSVIYGEQAKNFADHVLKPTSQPGNGNVRTKQGGYKIK